MNNLKCADKIQQEFESRNQDFSDIFTLQNDFKNYEDSFEAFADFGASIDYIEPNTYENQKHGYWRYQLSGGGPSDELRFYLDDNKELWKAEYCYFEWFDGAILDVTDEGNVYELWDNFVKWTLPL